jgi:hypothetical protein
VRLYTYEINCNAISITSFLNPGTDSARLFRQTKCIYHVQLLCIRKANRTKICKPQKHAMRKRVNIKMRKNTWMWLGNLSKMRSSIRSLSFCGRFNRPHCDHLRHLVNVATCAGMMLCTIAFKILQLIHFIPFIYCTKEHF